MATQQAKEILADWPEAAREAAQLVVDTYGEPEMATAAELTWTHVGTWKRIVAQRAFWAHDFPAPHTDSVESFVDYEVPAGHYGDIARFDGSVMLERTTGEASARCHDEQANRLALNLMHDIVTGAKTTDEARAYYAKEFLAGKGDGPTPYMDKLNFEPMATAADPDARVLSDAQLEEAKRSKATPAS